MPVDPPYNIYQDELSSRSHGLALWDPNPLKQIHDKVSIGDVGYLDYGAFVRMFNVALPWDHPSNGILGRPDPYDSLDSGRFTNTHESEFGEVVHISRSVTADTYDEHFQDMTPDDLGGVTYKFQNRYGGGRGALLSLPNGGRRLDVIRTKVFGNYIQSHVDRWFIWAKNNMLSVEYMEDLILVSGCTLVTAWAAAACPSTVDTSGAQISLTSRSLSNVGASFVWNNVRGDVEYHNSRFDPQNPPTMADQCVFIRGFRAKRSFFGIRVTEIGNSRADEDPPRSSSYRRPLQRRKKGLRSSPSSLGNDTNFGVSSSSLDTIVPINHENPQLLPYPSSITLQSNGSVYNASFITSPSYGSLIESLNDIAEEDDFAEDTTNNTDDDDPSAG